MLCFFFKLILGNGSVPGGSSLTSEPRGTHPRLRIADGVCFYFLSTTHLYHRSKRAVRTVCVVLFLIKSILGNCDGPGVSEIEPVT